MENYIVCLIVAWCAFFSWGINVEASIQYLDRNLHAGVTISADKQPSRTAYHLQAPKNWLNDPNGPMYYKGIYHQFYQYNPYGEEFGEFGETIIWAHAVSYDLINWNHLKPALYPTTPFDAKSCMSGSVTFLRGNKPVILYTGVNSNNQQVQNLAMPKNLSDPFLIEWEKYSRNPVITPPEGVKDDEFRDPTTAWKGKDGKWRIVIGSSKNNKGLAILYHSDDFKKWRLSDHPLYSASKTGIWECPDFYPLADNSKNGVNTSLGGNFRNKYALKVGYVWRDYYAIGRYNLDVDKFIPYKGITGTYLDLRYDYGKFYASKTFFDSAKNRRILWGWVNESDSSADDKKKGWAGIQSIPRQVYLAKNGKQLVTWPVEEIERLRGNHVSYSDKELKGHSLFEVPGITASQADVEISFKLSNCNLKEADEIDTKTVDPQILCSKNSAAVNSKVGPLGLLVFASKNLTERTAIFFRIFQDHNKFVVLMCNDQSRSTLQKGVDKTTYGAFVDINPSQESISLRSLVDRSVVESFAGEGRASITARVYPTLAIDDEAHSYAFNNGTLSVVVSKLNAWSMKKANIT